MTICGLFGIDTRYSLVTYQVFLHTQSTQVQVILENRDLDCTFLEGFTLLRRSGVSQRQFGEYFVIRRFLSILLREAVDILVESELHFLVSGGLVAHT